MVELLTVVTGGSTDSVFEPVEIVRSGGGKKMSGMGRLLWL